MSCEVSGRRVTTDEECVMSPIWSPKLTQASSTPGHSSHTSCLQSPLQDPRLKLATTAGKRAVPPGPDHLVTVHKQPSAGFAPLAHTRVWARLAAPPGVRCAAAAGAAPRASQRPAVSIPQQIPRGHAAPQVPPRRSPPVTANVSPDAGTRAGHQAKWSQPGGCAVSPHSQRTLTGRPGPPGNSSHVRTCVSGEQPHCIFAHFVHGFGQNWKMTTKM